MNLSQCEIQLKASGYNTKGNNKLLPYLYPWQYGRELYSDQDFYQMLNSYKSWIYVCSKRNASNVANSTKRLYVAKNNKGKRLKGYQTREVTKSTEKRIYEDPFLQNIPAVRKAAEFEEILEHPYLDLISKPNNFMGNFDLMEMTQLMLELTGNAYWHIQHDKFGTPKEIWILPTVDIKIVPDRKKFISGYLYTKGGEEIFLEEKSIIHHKFPNPRNPYYGFAPYNAIREEFMLGNSINKYEDKMFANQGVLSGVFETDESLDDHAFERLKLEIQQTYTGLNNVGRSPLLDNGLKYKPMQQSAKEMSFLGGRELVKESLLNAYDLSLALFSKDSNRANVFGALHLYAKQAIAPRLARMQEKINHKLMWKYDPSLFMFYDDCVPDDMDFKLNERVKNVQTSVTSVDEERILMGKEPYGGIFSEPFIPVNYTIPSGILQSIANGTGKGNIVDSPEKMKELLNR